MSRTNHNMLYFVAIRGNRPLNMGICLWKAQNRLSERGLDAELAPKIVQTPGRPADPTPNRSLASARPLHKTQNWCKSRALLCELWTIAPNDLMTAKVASVHGSRLRKGFAPAGQAVAILRLFPT